MIAFDDTGVLALDRHFLVNGRDTDLKFVGIRCCKFSESPTRTALFIHKWAGVWDKAYFLNVCVPDSSSPIALTMWVLLICRLMCVD